jgi:hypothetical protein
MHQRSDRQWWPCAATKWHCLLLLYLLMVGCRSAQRTPSISFTRVPSSNQGGPNTSGFIEGQVRGAHSGEKIVLYAKGHSWWVQPAADKAFINIDDQGRWSSATHLGVEYAALLVGSEYRPPLITDDLPAPGSGVRAVATVSGVPVGKPEVVPVIHFSDYDWEVGNTPNLHLGTMHDYKTANVRVDSKGFLHLKIKRRGDQWTCSQLILTRSLGYGTYRFVVQDVSKLEPAAVLDLYTWNASDIERNRRELDIRLSRWGDAAGKNAEYVVQPYYVPQNVSTFSVGRGTMVYSMEWRQASVSFSTNPINSSAGRARDISSHVFTSGIPSPATETAHISFCEWTSGKTPMHADAEVVIEKFQYLP